MGNPDDPTEPQRRRGNGPDDDLTEPHHARRPGGSTGRQRPGGAGDRTERVHSRGASERTRRWPPRRIFMVVAGGLSVAVLVAAVALRGLTGYAMGEVQRVAALQGLDDRPSRSGGVNVLVVGSDRRAGLSPEMRQKLHVGKTPGRRSDTMMLAHIAPRDHRVTIVSLPRDWRVTIPAHTNADGERVEAEKAKLNSAYSRGGASLAAATVEKTTGVRLDHYVEVSLLGFVEVVNAIGGVDVCVPQPVNDPASGLKLPKGKSHLGGVQSLKYVRARKTLGDGTDIGRMRRQQEFLASMMQQALSTGTLLNPVKFTRFLNSVLRSVTVNENFSSADLRRLGLVLRGLQATDVQFLTVPIDKASLSPEKPGIAANTGKARQLFTRIQQNDPVGKHRNDKDGGKQRGNGSDGNGGGNKGQGVSLPPDRIEIEVYNDTNTSGLGARATEDLRSAGFQIEQPPRNADAPNDAETTVIQYGPGRAESARTLAAALPGAQRRKVPELGDDVQVVVGSSYDGTRQVQAGGSGGSGSGGSGSGGLDTRSGAKKPCA